MRTSLLIPGESFSRGRRRGGEDPPSPAALLRAPGSACLPTQAPQRGKTGSTWFVNVAVALGRDKRGAAQSCPEPHCSAHTRRCKAPVEAAARPQGRPCSVLGWLEKHSTGKSAPNLISQPSRTLGPIPEPCYSHSCCQALGAEAWRPALQERSGLTTAPWF